MSSFSELLKTQLDSSTDTLNNDWSNIAQAHHWDEDVHSAVKVVSHSNGVGLSYPTSMHSKVMSAEYGDESIPPRAAMRNFKEHAQPEVGKAVFTALSDYLKEKGLF